MPKRKKHPSKEIEKAIQYAESRVWRYKKAGGSSHAWGRMYCALGNREGCAVSIWSTPRNEKKHAEQIMRRVKQCPHILKQVK